MNKNHRLNKSEQILNTIKSNNVVYSSTVNMFYRKNDLSKWQIAVIASKKKFKTAVQRNKIRRQLKAIIRELNVELGDYQIVFIVKQEWINKTYLENRTIVYKLLTKLSKGAVKDVK